MAEFFMMPAASPTMEVGRLASWICSEGDAVEFGTVVAEVETDKATAEIESFDDGVLLRFFSLQGQMLPLEPPLPSLVKKTTIFQTLSHNLKVAQPVHHQQRKKRLLQHQNPFNLQVLSKQVPAPEYKQMQVVFLYHQ